MGIYDLSVLYIDDDDLAIEYFELISSKLVKKIFTANSGAEGIEIFLNEKPDVVIVDIIMPDITGIEVAAKIKSKFSGVEIIGVSSSNAPDNLISAINAGIRNFMLKPLTREKINAVLEESFERVKLNRELGEYREKLENLVEIRTDRLQRANEKLISERELKNRAQKKLEFFYEIFENSDTAMAIFDSKGVVLHANRRAHEKLNKDNLEGEVLFELFPKINKYEYEQKLLKEGKFFYENIKFEKFKGNIAEYEEDKTLLSIYG